MRNESFLRLRMLPFAVLLFFTAFAGLFQQIVFLDLRVSPLRVNQLAAQGNNDGGEYGGACGHAEFATA